MHNTITACSRHTVTNIMCTDPLINYLSLNEIVQTGDMQLIRQTHPIHTAITNHTLMVLKMLNPLSAMVTTTPGT